MFDKFLTAVFVDGVWLHKLWGCHRRADRSFFVNGRQFHVCARCTGLISGIPLSVLLLPFRMYLGTIFVLFAVALISDGITQMLDWRVSTNVVRFITGVGTSATFLSFLVASAGKI